MKKKFLLLVLCMMLAFMVTTAPAMAADIKIYIDGEKTSATIELIAEGETQ